ncbi:type II secretion system F family protein [Permianibacter aggregans]|uniref:MSHA biogenesis protein MshG n=1 Tax=Permianibacter aggregans TaxID=1510150 RepID=A0A4V3D858_9GAMM|nr:type II secretion system F family protein [Permianibacter aggregans]QGX38648.1 type II secretion system F family protein [Permianibacter aggregans]TDQ50437.1 MSHA biogenesis protein MshG [Permianibacter aggregans]
MPFYYYKGRNKAGEIVENRVESGSADALASRLLADGITPIHIDEQIAAVPKRVVKFTLFKRGQTQLPDLIMFSRQMYSLTKAGVPIIRAITSLAETTQSEELAEALRHIVDDLSGGIELAAAIGKQGHVFTPLYVSMVHVGENTGRLDLAFEQLSSYLELEMLTRQRIKEALRYPSFVVVAMIAALFVINIFVIPAFSGMFAAFKAELPLPTRILIFVSDFFLAYWPYMAVALIAAFVFFKQWKATIHGELRWDGWKIRFPIVGPIIHRALLSRFARSFSMCQRAGVPISTSLAVVANAVDNAKVAQQVRKMREGVERGENISRAARNTGMFSPLVLQMLVVGEETGQLDQLLDEVADFYEREVDYDLKKLSQNIEPILIVAMGIMVLVLALGIFLPMWELASAARGN